MNAGALGCSKVSLKEIPRLKVPDESITRSVLDTVLRGQLFLGQRDGQASSQPLSLMPGRAGVLVRTPRAQREEPIGEFEREN